MGTNSIHCDICKQWIHRKCALLSIEELQGLSMCEDQWYCSKCLLDIFPFYDLESEELYSVISDIQDDKLYVDCNDLNLDLFDLNTKQIPSLDHIDPNNVYIPSSSKYYTIDDFNAKVSKSDGFSILSVNIRSIRSNWMPFNIFLKSLNLTSILLQYVKRGSQYMTM